MELYMHNTHLAQFDKSIKYEKRKMKRERTCATNFKKRYKCNKKCIS